MKAAPLNSFILTIDEMMMHNIKGVTRSDKTADSYLPTLKCPSAPRNN